MSADQAGPEFVPAGYTIIHKLGSGQTSHVYLARHRVFGDVALKLPRPEIQDRPVLKRMFENEVSITVKLASPHVVGAFDGYPTGSAAFIALEHCAGGTLDQLLLEKGQLPLERAYELVLEVALGLAHTHEHSVLHRDVKPANVFLTGEGHAKLGDFGTGVFQSDEGEDRVGTAFYMGPEVFEGKSAGVRSDVYSLGILGYEVIAGKRPFIADTYEALMVAHHTDVPKDLASHRAQVDPHMKRIIAKAMSRDPDKRFASAREMTIAIRSVLGKEERESSERPAPPSTGRGSRQAAKPAEDTKSTAERKGGVFGWLKRSKN
jgi:serine/threonine-protein kinase